jgi:hypothetical protein
MRRDGLKQIERAEAVDGQSIPEAIVAAGPHQPHVAAFDLLLSERPHRLAMDDVEIHVAEVIVGGRRKILRRQACPQRFVLDGSRFRL